jgi:hypothetical protein
MNIFNIHVLLRLYFYIMIIQKSALVITPFSLKIGTLNYLFFSSYLFIKSFASINK